MRPTPDQLSSTQMELRLARAKAQHLLFMLKLVTEHLEDGSPEMALHLAKEVLEDWKRDHNGN